MDQSLGQQGDLLYHSAVAHCPGRDIAEVMASQKSASQLLRGIRNASYLAAGNFVTQVISFIGFIYIARMLGPYDYGIYVTVGAFVGMFDILLLGGLNKTVMREGSKDLASMHIHLEKTIGLRNVLVLIAIIVCIICSLFTPYGFQTKLYIVLFSSQLVYTGLRGFLGTIYQATEKMHYISILSIANRALFVCLSIAFLWYGFGLLALFLIALFSHFSTLAINYRLSQRFVNFNFFSKVQFDKDLLKPALIFSLMVFLVFLITRIDLLMISFLGTAEDVGIYGVASKICRQGMMLRNVTVTAFFPIFVKRFHSGAMNGRRLLQYSLLFFSGVLALALAFSFFVEEATTFLFGSEYQNSGGILKVLMFYVAFSWATLPFTTAAQATHNEKYMLIALSIMAASNVPLNYAFFLKYGLIGIAYSKLVIFSVGSFLVSGVAYGIMRRQGLLT
jgi:O-antigen/teichoic acid export membrane protein